MERAPRGKQGAAVGECRALIIGPNSFQNLLLAAYIETHGGWKPALCQALDAVPAKKGECRTAVLVDCFGMSGPAVQETLLPQLGQLPRGWFMVLFNLDRGSGVESCALARGVHGFFYEDDPPETLLKGLAAMFLGELWVSRRKMEEVIIGNGFRLLPLQASRHNRPHNLTRREMEVLGLLTMGGSNDGIARKLFISPHTVRTHLYHIFRKIKVGSRLEASVWAAQALFQQSAE